MTSDTGVESVAVAFDDEGWIKTGHDDPLPVCYMVVTAGSLSNLVTDVRREMTGGWHPVGGVMFIEGAHDLLPCTYLQAMVRYPEPVTVVSAPGMGRR